MRETRRDRDTEMDQEREESRKAISYSMQRPNPRPARDKETIGRMLWVRGYNTVNGNAHLDVTGVTT